MKKSRFLARISVFQFFRISAGGCEGENLARPSTLPAFPPPLSPTGKYPRSWGYCRGGVGGQLPKISLAGRHGMLGRRPRSTFHTPRTFSLVCYPLPPPLRKRKKSKGKKLPVGGRRWGHAGRPERCSDSAGLAGFYPPVAVNAAGDSSPVDSGGGRYLRFLRGVGASKNPLDPLDPEVPGPTRSTTCTPEVPRLARCGYPGPEGVRPPCSPAGVLRRPPCAPEDAPP